MTRIFFGLKPPRHRTTYTNSHNIWINDNGRFWSGWTPDNLTKEELLFAVSTTLADLLEQFPELRGVRWDSQGNLIQKS